MIGRFSQFKWTNKQEHSRDLIFIIFILGFGLVVVAKLAPYYRDTRKTVVISTLRATPTVPKGLVDQINAPLLGLMGGDHSKATRGNGWIQSGHDHPSAAVAERVLFDGQTVLLKARLLTPYSSKDESTPLEAVVVGAIRRFSDSEIDFSASDGAKLVGVGRANFLVKRLLLTFSEMISHDGRSYAVQGQAVDPATQTASIEGDYSSGLATRIAGIGLERLIMAADQVGMARLFSVTVPQNQAAAQFETAAIETNQEASASISGAATQDLRDAQPQITLQPGFEFQVRLKAQSQEAGSK